MINLTFEKLYRYPRVQEPCAVTVPLPEGRVRNPEAVTVWQQGRRVASQTRVLSRHRDGSARYLFVRFLADLPGNAGTTLQCCLEGEAPGIEGLEGEVPGIEGLEGEALDIEGLEGEAPGIEGLEGEVPGIEGLEGEAPGIEGLEGEVSDIEGPEGLNEEAPEDGVETGKGIVCVESENGYDLDCGALRFSVRNDSSRLFHSFDDGMRSYTAGQFQGPCLKTRGQMYGIRFGRWQVEELGRVCVVLKAAAVCEQIIRDVGGALTPAAEGGDCEADAACGENHNPEYNCRITAYAEKPWLELSFQLINTSDLPLHVESWSFSLNMTGEEIADEREVLRTTGISGLPELEKRLDVRTVRTCVGTANYKTRFTMAGGGRPLTQLVDSDFLMKEGTEHLAEVFYGTFFADRTDGKGGVCATIFQAHQNYPKAVKADQNGVHVMLVPENSDQVVMESGMAREQRFQLHFHPAGESLVEIDNRSLIYQMPDRPVIAAGYFREAGVMPRIFIGEQGKKDFDAETWLITRCDSHARCFGMLNWGDAPDPGYTAQGRAFGELVWTNNEYDFPHACAMLYARTGIRRFLDYCLVAGSHWKDVDVCHYSANPLLYGGQWEHTGGHVKDGSIVCSHEWVEGLIDCYHFTGDESYLETALGIGDNVLRLLETPMYQNSGELSARETGWALRTLTALYTETRDEKWVGRAEWIVGQFREWAGKYGRWLAPYTDNVLIRVPFMISVAVGSLMRYYQEFPSAQVREMILDAVDDMVENCLFDNGYFYYKEIPSLTRIGTNTLVLEALAYAYRLTGEKSYLKAGLKTFRNTLRTPPDYVVFPKRVVKDAVLYGAQPTKDFAQSFLPVSVFYTALSEAEMLESV